MGLSGLEPPTSRLSGVRSNRLSYKPSASKCASLMFITHKVCDSLRYATSPFPHETGFVGAPLRLNLSISVPT